LTERKKQRKNSNAAEEGILHHRGTADSRVNLSARGVDYAEKSRPWKSLSEIDGGRRRKLEGNGE